MVVSTGCSALNETRWPFVQVLDGCHGPIDWAIVNGPIVTHTQQQQFAELRRAGYRFGGMSSYMTFPRSRFRDPLDYEMVCEVWCHCFREPDRFLSTAIPRELISASDFTDYHRISPERVTRLGDLKKFDLVYVGATESWKKKVKNWRLAARCIPKLCRELRLRALVIGSANAEFPPSPGITFSLPLPWSELLAHLIRARFLFVPNVLDASPRLLTEALCLNVPVVVNRNILGGWKYVNRFTGGFFDGEGNIIESVCTCLERNLAPRDWFRSNYGPYLAGQRLLRLLKYVDSELTERSHLSLAERLVER
jgi:glycosyltransferase involved in cell wall biosynthesis